MDEFIDRPAQQIFIEGLVLEISEAGLKTSVLMVGCPPAVMS